MRELQEFKPAPREPRRSLSRDENRLNSWEKNYLRFMQGQPYDAKWQTSFTNLPVQVREIVLHATWAKLYGKKLLSPHDIEWIKKQETLEGD